MKYYETSFEEYLQSKNNLDIHPEIKIQTNKLPKDVNKLNNLIIYGPSGSGKYSIALDIINKYSHNELKYDKRTTVFPRMYSSSPNHIERYREITNLNKNQKPTFRMISKR